MQPLLSKLDRRSRSRPICSRFLAGGVLVVAAWVAGGAVPAAELAPVRIVGSPAEGSEVRGWFSERSLTLGLEIDRDRMRLIAYTVKPHPFVAAVAVDDARAHDEGPRAQLEIVLLGPPGLRFTRRLTVGPICLLHDAGMDPHVEGDTIRMHRDSFVLRLPELAGFDTVEVAYHEAGPDGLRRRTIGRERLDRARFSPAGTTAVYDELSFADPADDGGGSTTSSTVIWPEDIPDPEIYRVDGDEAEIQDRINIVIVPDGYTYAEKALMETHADNMVAHFRTKTPHMEHDPFFNYTLVYAYSVESGTDQCDCGIVLDTAMGTRFPLSNPTCGHSDNRCLSYGGGCDTSGTQNIIAAELRAPAHDQTVIMVNTTRYGGCGGSRATFAAGNSSATELAVHELGHSLGGLDDEYAGNNSCGTFAGEINTSLNSVVGAWPEWIADLGPPPEGARYYNQCIYRPVNDCEMRNLNQPFCAVCNQHWSLVVFGHSRVSPTAPIRSSYPPDMMSPCTGVPASFSVDPRLSVGAVTNDFTWTISGPGYPEPTVVSTGSPGYTHDFTQTGAYLLACEVTADTNFVKPTKNGANQESVTWQLDVTGLEPPIEVPPPGGDRPLKFTDTQTLTWGDTSAGCAATYNLYRGDVADLPSGSYGTCDQSDLPDNTATVTQIPPPSTAWFYLVTGANASGEGPMGSDSAGDPRTNGAPCN